MTTDIDAAPAAPPDAHASDPGKWLVLGAVCLAGIMMPLSFTGPSVGLPAIARDLGGSATALAWVVNGFILSFGSAVMAAGALADRYGRKRMFRLGLWLFAVASFLVGLAPNVLVLDLLRALQGVMAALAMLSGAASLAHEFEGPARTRAYSLLGTSFGVGLAFGPIICGVFIESLGWRSMFFLCAALAVFVVLVGVPRMRESRDPDAKGFDVLGTASFTAALALLTFGILQAPQSGWGSATVVGLLAAAAVSLVAFVLIERAQARPMLDLSLFLYPRFVGVQSLPISTAFGFVVPLVYLPIRFVGIEGLSEVDAGLMLMPLCLPTAVVPFLGGLLARWIPSGLLCGIGLFVAAAGLASLAVVPPGAAPLAFALPMLAIGVGTAIPWGLMDDLAVSVVPKERAGMAMGIFATMRVAGEAIAIAIIAAVMLALTQGALGLAVDGLAAESVVAAANHVAGGNLAAAGEILPGLGRSGLVAAYAAAFETTMMVLAIITACLGIVAVAVVRRTQARVPAVAAEPAAVCETAGG